MILPDVLDPGLRVVFCGTAAGKRSAQVGAYYAGPGNAFWPTLHEVGFTPRRLAPSEFRDLPRFVIGLTDMCKLRSGSDTEIGTGGFVVAAWASLSSGPTVVERQNSDSWPVRWRRQWPSSSTRNRHVRRGIRDAQRSILVLNGASARHLDRRAAG